MDTKTLRHWPWLVMAGVGAVVFGGLAVVAGKAMSGMSSGFGAVMIGGATLGLGALTFYCVASLRTRTILRPAGPFTVDAFAKHEIPWSAVSRLDVIHALPGWMIRAWPASGPPTVIFRCHDTWGKRPKALSTFEQPPPDAPTALHRAYTAIEEFRRTVRTL